MVVDSDFNLMTINAASLEIFQVNRDDIVIDENSGKRSKFRELVPKKEESRWQKMIEAVFSEGEDYREDRFFHNTDYEEKNSPRD